MSGLFNPQAFGVPPNDPLNGPYGPFQRYAMQGTYLNFPRSLPGKLFFSLGTQNFVCSASPINRSTIATAGHCLSSGNGTFATNVLFCPSYTQAGVNPARGCWSVVQIWTTGPWHVNGDPDYDYACRVTHTVGTIIANKMGNVTGWAGRAWNWVDVPEMTFGYPQAAPFNGTIIQQTASVDWYNVDFTPGAQVSKVIGSDLTGGSSGGPWYLSWRHPSAEVADTDGFSSTDPVNTSGPHINGVNSHKRCRTHCGSPPSAVAGVFWQEMTSPPFRLDPADGNDSEDIFALCFAHVNNN
jgi:V8-like Glu-specific endopeptidase